MKRHNRYSRIASGTCGCALASLLPFDLAWSDWEAAPDVRMEVEANDNPRLGQSREDLEPDDDAGQTATRMLMDARVRFVNAGPRGEVRLRPRVRVDAYADEADEELERQDAYLNALARYDWSRASAGVRFDIARESIISSELLETGILDPADPIEDPIDTETGLLVLLNEYRKSSVFAPFAQFAVSERSSILVDARYLDVSYTGPELRGRTDIQDTELSLGVGRTIDDRTGAIANLIVSRFEAEANGNVTDTVGVEGRFNRELNALWTFTLATGLQRSEFAFVEEDGAVVDNAATNYTFDIQFSKQTELGTLSIGALRMLNPNAVGFLVERDELRLNYRRRLSERLSTGVGLRLVQTEAMDRPLADRDYVRADFDVEWSFTPSWALSVRYGAVDQSLSGDRIDGTANLLSVGAVYRGLTRDGQGGQGG